jgi:uncharacterized membrane protein YheB (UPF0754 family)
MHVLHFIVPVVFCGFTGWITAWLLLKLMFHPQNPLPFAGTGFRGVLPQNQSLIAARAGQFAAEAFSFEELERKITNPETIQKLKPAIETHIDTFLREKLKSTFPMLSVFIGDKTINQLKAAFLTEVESLFPEIMKNYMEHLKEDINIEKTVADKINAISLPQLETALKLHGRRELLIFKGAGAMAGIIIGLLQALLNILV